MIGLDPSLANILMLSMFWQKKFFEPLITIFNSFFNDEGYFYTIFRAFPTVHDGQKELINLNLNWI